MASEFITIIIQFVMGILIGIFNQADDKISIWDSFWAIAAFLGVNIFNYILHPEAILLRTCTVLCLGWIAVWIGLFTGSAARHDLKYYFMSYWFESLAKRELQALIAEFLRLSSRMVYFNNQEEQEHLDNTLGKIDQHLEQILNKYANLDNVTGKFMSIKDICHLYYELSQSIIATHYSPEIIAEWTKLGDYLEQVSHQSLCYAESEIIRSIGFNNILERLVITLHR